MANYTCGRCNGSNGSYQGHYWSFCKVTGKVEKFHFCCPDNCALFPNGVTNLGTDTR